MKLGHLKEFVVVSERQCYGASIKKNKLMGCPKQVGVLVVKSFLSCQWSPFFPYNGM